MHEFFDRFYPRVLDVCFEELDPSSLLLPPIDAWRFGYAVSGKGVLEREDGAEEIEAGHFFLIGSGAHMALKARDGADALRIAVVAFEYKLIEWENPDMAAGFRSDTRLPFAAVNVLPFSFEISSELERLYELWTRKEKEYSARARLLFVDILLRIHGKQQDYCNDPTKQSIRQCMEYIEHHFQEPLERDLLASKVSLSSSYFSIMFKKYAGCSPVQFITGVRLKRAMKLLKETDKPISAIALEVGFRDPLYFSKVFTREVGLTPKQYRSKSEIHNKEKVRYM